MDSLQGVERFDAEKLTTAGDAYTETALNKGPWISPWWKAWWSSSADIAAVDFGQSSDGDLVAIDASAAAHFLINNGSSGSERWKGGASVTGEAVTVGFMAIENQYQFAWSHAWSFEDSIILDDLMVFLRTDSTYAATFTDASGTFQKEEGYKSGAFGDADHLIVQITVDNPLNRNDRRLNNVVVMQHQVKLKDIMYSPYELTTSGQRGYVGDMLPNVTTGTNSVDKILQGPIVRLRDLNIPIPPGSNVRLAIIIPWLCTARFSPYTGGLWPSVGQQKFACTVTKGNPTTVTTVGSHYFVSGDEVTFDSSIHVDPAGDDPAKELQNTSKTITVTGADTFTVAVDTSTSGDGSGAADLVGFVFRGSAVTGYVDQGGWAVKRPEPMFDWCLNGCLTVLEEVKD
jgi:hypothetical protein